MPRSAPLECVWRVERAHPRPFNDALTPLPPSLSRCWCLPTHLPADRKTKMILFTFRAEKIPRARNVLRQQERCSRTPRRAANAWQIRLVQARGRGE